MCIRDRDYWWYSLRQRQKAFGVHSVGVVTVTLTGVLRRQLASSWDIQVIIRWTLQAISVGMLNFHIRQFWSEVQSVQVTVPFTFSAAKFSNKYSNWIQPWRWHCSQLLTLGHSLHQPGSSCNIWPKLVWYSWNLLKWSMGECLWNWHRSVECWHHLPAVGLHKCLHSYSSGKANTASSMANLWEHKFKLNYCSCVKAVSLPAIFSHYVPIFNIHLHWLYI